MKCYQVRQERQKDGEGERLTVKTKGEEDRVMYYKKRKTGMERDRMRDKEGMWKTDKDEKKIELLEREGEGER
jgi:hypothetical protein